jgi:hypothetical protein
MSNNASEKGLTNDEHQNLLLRNFSHNYPRLFAEYLELPVYTPGMVVRCPTRNRDGSPIDADNIRGCGGAAVGYDGDVYDCYDCGIFFSDYAADPPHRRREDHAGNPVVWSHPGA